MTCVFYTEALVITYISIFIHMEIGINRMKLGFYIEIRRGASPFDISSIWRAMLVLPKKTVPDILTEKYNHRTVELRGIPRVI